MFMMRFLRYRLPDIFPSKFQCHFIDLLLVLVRTQLRFLAPLLELMANLEPARYSN